MNITHDVPAIAQDTHPADAVISPGDAISLLRALHRTFGRRHLRGVDRDDLVQETICRVLQIDRKGAISIPRALRVASHVWSEALRRRSRTEARLAPCDDLDELDVPRDPSPVHTEDLRSAIRAQAQLSPREHQFLSICLIGHDIETAGAQMSMSTSASYYMREKIMHKIRTATRLRSLIQ